MGPSPSSHPPKRQYFLTLLNVGRAMQQSAGRLMGVDMTTISWPGPAEKIKGGGEGFH